MFTTLNPIPVFGPCVKISRHLASMGHHTVVLPAPEEIRTGTWFYMDLIPIEPCWYGTSQDSAQPGVHIEVVPPKCLGETYHHALKHLFGEELFMLMSKSDGQRIDLSDIDAEIIIAKLTVFHGNLKAA